MTGVKIAFGLLGCWVPVAVGVFALARASGRRERALAPVPRQPERTAAWWEI